MKERSDNAAALEAAAEDLSEQRGHRVGARDRGLIATGVSTMLSDAVALNEAERKIALDIVAVLAQDVADNVRIALAEHIKKSPYLPREIAKNLASDIESVAVPIIEVSAALSDRDLIEIVRDGAAAKQVAVARRPSVSAEVSSALAGTERKPVVQTLLANDGARIDEETFHTLLGTFAEENEVLGMMVDRGTLPLSVKERLIGQISTELRDRLVQQHDLPRHLAEEMSTQARERSLVASIGSELDSGSIERLVATLYADGSLTPTLVLRALCQGDYYFFQAAMAVLSNHTIATVRDLLHHRGAGGFKRLYRAAALPEHLFRAFRVALDVTRERWGTAHPSGSQAGIEDVIGRIVREYRDICPADIEGLLSQLSQRLPAAEALSIRPNLRPDYDDQKESESSATTR